MTNLSLLWEKFLNSGKIEDYLKYKRASNKKELEDERNILQYWTSDQDNSVQR